MTERSFRNSVAALMAVLVLSLTACATTERTAYRTLGTISVAADTAMLAWGEYVRTNAAAGTPVAANLEAAVRDAYSDYQNKMFDAEVAVHAYLRIKTGDLAGVNVSLDAVRAASIQLVHLIYQLKGGN